MQPTQEVREQQAQQCLASLLARREARLGVWSAEAHQSPLYRQWQESLRATEQQAIRDYEELVKLHIKSLIGAPA